MTKRLKSKHKVDRRLKVNLWGRPKSPFNARAYPPGQHGQTKSSKPKITAASGFTATYLFDILPKTPPVAGSSNDEQ